MTASKRYRYRTQLCRACKGTGLQLDPVSTGKMLRSRRKDYGVTLREMARRMQLSVVYLWNLEKGQRRWTQKLKARFEEALGV